MVSKEVQKAEEHLLHIYHRYPVTLDYGKGVYLYDTDEKQYLDFAAGIAVMSLGYQNKELEEELSIQLGKLCHTSNLFYHNHCGKAAEALAKVSGMDQVFFTNSGTEAIEGALKVARKYAYRKHSGRYEIIAMKNSFHGRSMGAVSVTGTKAYREPFEPMIGGVKFAEFNNLESVKALVNEKTCAILLEPIQGEGGIHVATKEFMEEIREICNKQDILMICDEIQCGMGRTGTMFAWQGYGVRPDILTMAKAIGNGIPVGAFAVTEHVAKHSLEPGDHGSTYGGNPLACVAVKKVLEIFEDQNIVEHVKEVSSYLTDQLNQLTEEVKCVIEHRGCGLIQGITITKNANEVVQKALKEGLILITAKDNTIRFVPPLIIEKQHVDEMIRKLKYALE